MTLERFLNWYGPKPNNISDARWRAMFKQMEGALNASKLDKET